MPPAAELRRVHCPNCQSQFRVPINAGGKTARCPSCKEPFVIPPPDDLIEETISSWLEEDLDDVADERQRELEELIRKQEEEKARLKREAEEAARFVGRPKVAPKPPSAAPRPSPAAHASGSSGVSASPATSHAPVAAHPAPAPRADDVPSNYPIELRPLGPFPHLVVAGCSQDGVKFAFDSAWLEHDGFRLSLPVRCVFTGEANRAKLYARPLAFIDRSQARLRSPRDIEARHEHNLGASGGGQSTRAFLDTLGLLEDLPKPFNRPMPYYVTAGHSNISLQCVTHTRPDGVTCVVTVPDGRYALEWLLRVNGACGPEHALLERDVALFWSDAWRELPEHVRARINAWCTFEPGERFHTYLIDGDFAKSDAGLAGIVFTDRRLVHCKYHHKGQLRFDRPGTMHAHPRGEFIDLIADDGQQRQRFGRLHAIDLPKLNDALRVTPVQLVQEVV